MISNRFAVSSGMTPSRPSVRLHIPGYTKARAELGHVQRLRKSHPLQRLPRGIQPNPHSGEVADPAPNLEPREDIWPTDKAPVIRRFEDGTNEFAELRWGFPPAGPKAGPVINFRSEGRRFPVGRCLVPASHFFEFTGTKSPKTKWKFTNTSGDWFCFAGLLATDARRVRRGVHDPDDRAGSGCRADPQSPSRRAR